MVQLKAMWAPDSGTTNRGTDPEKVAGEIFSISDTPTASEIVNMASDPGKESYKLFDWDDAVAGPKWRLHQASKILGALKVEFVKKETEPDWKEKEKIIPVRLFYGNPMEEQKGYAAITTIMANDDMYQQLLERAKMELRAFQKKYLILTELESIFDLIDQL